jgi:hypothetical protein
MVVGFTTTYAISAYHHWCCEFEYRSGRGEQHYVIKFVSDCHNIISPVIKGEVLHQPKKLRYFRSYKTFDIENFNDDIEQIKINQTCHEVDYVYNEYEKDFYKISLLSEFFPIFVALTFCKLRI